MYKDKISAVIREITCNAVDAHVSAKTSEKVKVTLPSINNASFIVQDFGLGLSEKDVIHMYTTYFSSSKTDDNDQIGGFGLGSKSPFAYAEQFTVVSVFNGKTMTFVARKDEERKPVINKVFEADSTDHNGLTVMVPVATRDFLEFKSSAQRILFWVKDQIEVVGQNLDWAFEINNDLSNPGNYLFTKINNTNSSSSLYVKIGPVLYPVTNWTFMGENRTDEVYKTLRQLQYRYENRNLIMEAKIGTLNVAPSREELSYDPFTVKGLAALATSVVKMIKEDSQKKIDALSSSTFLQGKFALDLNKMIGLEIYDVDKDITFSIGTNAQQIILNQTTRGFKQTIREPGTAVVNASHRIEIVNVGSDFGKGKVMVHLKAFVHQNNWKNRTIIVTRGVPSKAVQDFFGVTTVHSLNCSPVTDKGVQIRKETKFYDMITGKNWTFSELKKIQNVFMVPVTKLKVFFKDSGIEKEDITSRGFTLVTMNSTQIEKYRNDFKTHSTLVKEITNSIQAEVEECNIKNYIESTALKGGLSKVIYQNADLPKIKSAWARVQNKTFSRVVRSAASQTNYNDLPKVKELKTEWTSVVESNPILSLMVRKVSTWESFTNAEQDLIATLLKKN